MYMYYTYIDIMEGHIGHLRFFWMLPSIECVVFGQQQKTQQCSSENPMISIWLVWKTNIIVKPTMHLHFTSTSITSLITFPQYNMFDIITLLRIHGVILLYRYSEWQWESLKRLLNIMEHVFCVRWFIGTIYNIISHLEFCDLIFPTWS